MSPAATIVRLERDVEPKPEHLQTAISDEATAPVQRIVSLRRAAESRATGARVARRVDALPPATADTTRGPSDTSPPAPRVIPLVSRGLRQIDIDPGTGESDLTRTVQRTIAGERDQALDRDGIAIALAEEWARHERGGLDGAVASLVLAELEAVRLRLGAKPLRQLLDDVTAAIRLAGRELDVIGIVDEREFIILMPDVDVDAAHDALEDITHTISTTVFAVGHERVLLTPAAGYAMLSDTESLPELTAAAERARAVSLLNLDLRLERWDGESTAPAPVAEAEDDEPAGDAGRPWRERLRTPSQILLTYLLGWVAPFLLYWGFDVAGFDITWPVFLVVVAALVLTGWFIVWEGLLAFNQNEPPEEPGTPYPRASAVIAAYLPNEAATVLDTIDAFLALDYPNDIQIILAYNTPDPLPVEKHLDRLAAKHPNFWPVKVEGSNSKAQNVNAVLPMVDGEFIGMFDADHHPRPDSFTRAWRWIDAGYDVVQGHCLTRNGDSGWLAKMIAVEFESIYAVAHPGRARMHRFGVFGGSNGFWRTKLLHETRMRGSMLTEDIDSSMRVIERGFKIRSDRYLVSDELATTTFQQIWNQRMRWAQGWFQVTVKHTLQGFRSRNLSLRQKLGMFHLLMWREAYPWLSLQMFPILGYWAFRDGFSSLNWTVPIFLGAAIFTLNVGPLQTFFTYRLADPEIKKHKAWFWGYLLFTTPFYAEYKNLIARVAHIKELMGESDWRVTPRSEEDG